MSAPEIVTRLGLRRSNHDWRGTCPLCGYADAFVLTVSRDGKPLGWCASCQNRDGISRLVRGEPLHPPTAAEAARRAALAARKADRALSLWRGSLPAVGTPVVTYLARRRLPDLATSEALRFCPDCPHPNGGRLPAMIAAVMDETGAVMGVHRTYINMDGYKAGINPAKASLGPIWGGAIRLHTFDPSTPLVVAEGIETAGAAGQLLNLAAWAALSAGNLAKGLVLPREVGHVIVAADPDEPGRQAARDAWYRWTAEGRKVQIATPDADGDFNDLLVEAADA